jgi:spoIIIJ-associated protein
MELSAAYAKKYLEDILSFFGLNTDVTVTANDEIIELSIPSSNMNGFLIGQRGDTLRALQALVSGALKNQNYEVSRVSVDVADYKKQRAHRVQEQAAEWIAAVKESGEDMHLKPMNAADRRAVHQLASDEGLLTESVGEGFERHIVLKKA